MFKMPLPTYREQYLLGVRAFNEACVIYQRIPLQTQTSSLIQATTRFERHRDVLGYTRLQSG